MKRFFLISTLLILLSGCMSRLEQSKVKTDRAEKESSKALPERFELLDSPEYSPISFDIREDCALDALWIMMNYRGLEVEKWKLERKFRPKKRLHFLRLNDLKPIAKSYGLPAFEVVIDDLETIKALVVSKMPPIVEFRAQFDQHPVPSGRPSFAIVVGYDEKKRLLFVDNPCSRETFSMPYSASYEEVCLVALFEGATEADVRKAVAKYISSEVSIK